MDSDEPRSNLLISVGGSPEPIAYSIDRHRPDKLIFFASSASRAQVNQEVRALCTHAWSDHEVITTPDPQDLTECLKTLRARLPECLRTLALQANELIVDYTGGTKTMSAALVLASIQMPVRYSYIGGTARSKDGMGTVEDGSESAVYTLNPWDELAVSLEARMAHQFNMARFAEAQATAEETALKVSPGFRPRYEGLARIAEGYGRWETFDYGGAGNQLKQGLERIRPYVVTADNAHWRAFLDAADRDWHRLAGLKQTFVALQGNQATDFQAVRELVLDLVANAVRTMRLAHRPDDAVARLYSALEKLAKARLRAGYGLDTSNTLPEQIPENLRDEYSRLYADAATGRLRFGLHAAFVLLNGLDDPLGRRYEKDVVALRQVLDIRNNSLMVHGWKPIRPEHFERLLDITLEFIEVPEADLPDLPEMPGN